MAQLWKVRKLASLKGMDTSGTVHITAQEATIQGSNILMVLALDIIFTVTIHQIAVYSVMSFFNISSGHP